MCFFVSDEGSRSNHRIRPCEQAPRCEFSRLSSDNQRLCDGAFSPKGRADTYALSSHKISKLNITRCSAVGSERGKTVNDCFDEVISPKQGAGEASVSSDNQRLCDGAFSPKGRADKCPPCSYYFYNLIFRGVAQLVARQFRVLEAWSSNLHTSTKKIRIALVAILIFLFGDG